MYHKLCYKETQVPPKIRVLPTGTHAHLTAFFPGLPGWASIRKVKPVWFLLKQETVSGSGISWAVCKSKPRSRQITMPAPYRSVFLQAGCPSCRPTDSVKTLKALLPTGTLPQTLELENFATACGWCSQQSPSTVEPVDYTCDGRASRGCMHKVYYTLVDCNPLTPLLRFVLDFFTMCSYSVVQKLVKFWVLLRCTVHL